MRRMERKALAALLLVITRIIKADYRIDAEEIEQLGRLEQQYGFDRSLMAEASRLTLAEAVRRLATLDAGIRQQVMASLNQLAQSDRMLERHEALLLLALRYCIDCKPDLKAEVLSGNKERHSGDLGSYIIYYEAERHEEHHHEIDSQWELMNLLTQQHGLQLMVVDHIVSNLCALPNETVRKLMGYLAPELNDAQLDQLQERMQHMDTTLFGQRVLVRDLQYDTLREASPSLLVSLGQGDLLRIELHDGVLNHLRRLLNDYSALASPNMEALRIIDNSMQQGHFRFYGYYHDFFNLLVASEPQESRMVLWPYKSEFSFPDAKCTLVLNQQEAALYTLILVMTYAPQRVTAGSKAPQSIGLPLCYTPDQPRIEALYRKIYCLKKAVESKEVIFPDNMAPIRAKIERKMREQLVGLDNLEDFIPRNVNREGFYRITAPASKVKVHQGIRQAEMGIGLYDWF